MEVQTFERALHLWPDWGESIRTSRQLLGYNLELPQDERAKWIDQHYYPEIRAQGEAELKRLGLPPNLQQYWEDCLYSDYQDKGGNIHYDRITRCLSERKSLPELPCESSLTWYPGEDIHDPWLRIEIRLHARFATRELFDYGAEQAFENLRQRLLTEELTGWTKYERHPVCQWLKGGRPKADESLAIECARLKDVEHWTYKEIGQHFGWSLQSDSYGNLNQCSSAKRYVKWGRALLAKNYQQ